MALFCNVDPAAVIQSIDVPSIYEVPLKMHQQHLDEIVLTKTGLPINGEPHLEPWLNFLHRMKNATKTVRIGLVGKYVELPDAYKSINESLFQAATYNDRYAFFFRWRVDCSGIWAERYRRKIHRFEICSWTRYSDIWRMFGHAMHGDRVCPRCVGIYRC